VADAEDDQRGEPLRVGLDAPDVDALGGGLLLDEAAHVLVADRGDQAGLQSEAHRADRDVGRAAADVFGEAGHVLQPAADLLSVQVDRGPADADHVERLGHLPSRQAATLVIARSIQRMLCASAPAMSSASCTLGAKGSNEYGPS